MRSRAARPGGRARRVGAGVRRGGAAAAGRAARERGALELRLRRRAAHLLRVPPARRTRRDRPAGARRVTSPAASRD